MRCSSTARPGLQRDACGALGPDILTALAAVAAAHGLHTSAIYITCLQNVMDVPVIDVGHARCVVTALLYKSLVTSVQTHSCTVQIVQHLKLSDTNSLARYILKI